MDGFISPPSSLATRARTSQRRSFCKSGSKRGAGGARPGERKIDACACTHSGCVPCTRCDCHILLQMQKRSNSSPLLPRIHGRGRADEESRVCERVRRGQKFSSQRAKTEIPDTDESKRKEGGREWLMMREGDNNTRLDASMLSCLIPNKSLEGKSRNSL